jgi:hypothetical protein
VARVHRPAGANRERPRPSQNWQEKDRKGARVARGLERLQHFRPPCVPCALAVSSETVSSGRGRRVSGEPGDALDVLGSEPLERSCIVKPRVYIETSVLSYLTS